MKKLKYLLEFFFIILLFVIFKLVGINFSRYISSKILSLIGPFFRSKQIIENNIKIAFPNSDQKFRKIVIKKMWKNYGKILSEYIFFKNFRENNSKEFLEIHGQEILEKIKTSKNLLYLYQDILIILN